MRIIKFATMKPLLFLSALMISLFAFSQESRTGYGTIKGVILTSDGQPAQYVSVTIKYSKEGTTTDERGNFEIKKVKAISHILDVTLLGYFDTSMTVEVLNNETVFLKVKLQRTYAELKAVVVRANAYVETRASESLRLNLPLTEIPQNIVVTTHQLLSDQGSLTMAEAFRTVSGVQKTGGGLNDISLMMRGTGVGWWSLYRNGVGAYWWNQQEDVAMIEKIEFAKGPAGFMTGASNGAGVPNVVTKQPVKEPVASVTAGLGSFNLMRLTTDLGGSVNKKGTISYRFVGGIHYQERSFQFGKALRYFICPVLKYDISSKTFITAEFNYMWGKTAGNNDNLPSINGKMFMLPRNFAAADDKSDRLIVADNSYRLNLKHNFNNNWHLNLQFAYAKGKWGGHFLNTDGSLPVSGDTLYRVASYDDWRNFSKQALAVVDGKFYTGKKVEHKVLIQPSVNHWGNTDASGGTRGQQKFGLYIPAPDYYIHPDSLTDYPIDDSTKLRLNEATFYAQDNIKIAGKLIITVAGRFTHTTISLSGYDNLPDYMANTRVNVFTPRGGLTWLFSDRLCVYALYDQFFNSQIGPTFNNEPLKPMTGYNLETGVKDFFFNRKLGLTSSAFHTVRNNLATADPEHPHNFIQKGQITSNGIDFDLTGNLTPSFVINANYEYVDAKITKDTDSLNVDIQNYGSANHSANLWLKYNLLKGRLKGLTFAVGYQFIGKRSGVDYYMPDPPSLPAHNLFDASVGYTNERFTVTLNVFNLTNITYAEWGYYRDWIGDWRYTPGEPINFRLSVGVNLLRIKRKSASSR